MEKPSLVPGTRNAHEAPLIPFFHEFAVLVECCANITKIPCSDRLQRYGNLVEIQLLVMNLITNAIAAFGEKKGFVPVSTDRVGLDGDYVQLKLAGSRPHMDATRARIFEAKRRVKAQGFCRSEDHPVPSRRHQRREHAEGRDYLRGSIAVCVIATGVGWQPECGRTRFFRDVGCGNTL